MPNCSAVFHIPPQALGVFAVPHARSARPCKQQMGKRVYQGEGNYVKVDKIL